MFMDDIADLYSQRAELHCHSVFSGKLSYAPFVYDSVMLVEDILTLARRHDVSILAITDHDTLDGYRYARELLDRSDGHDITLLPACEVSSSHGHILAYGITREIQKHISPEATIEAIHEQGGLAFAAHPFMFAFSLGKRVYDLPLDGIEGQNALIPHFLNRRATRAAKRLALPRISCSDSHHPYSFAKSVTMFAKGVDTWQKTVQALQHGQFITDDRQALIRYTPWAHLKGTVHVRRAAKKLARQVEMSRNI